MRIGIVSDIHCQHEALAAALAALSDDEVDAVWCAGDIVLQYRFCGETIELLRAAAAVAIQGNHDSVLVSPAGANARAGLVDGDDNLEWLAALPLQRETQLAGRNVLMVHGSPWPPYGDYLRPGDPRWREAASLDADVVITGHTHEPMVEQQGRTLVINPGSVGEPRQQPDRRASYAVLDLATLSAEIRHLNDPG